MFHSFRKFGASDKLDYACAEWDMHSSCMLLMKLRGKHGLWKVLQWERFALGKCL